MRRILACFTTVLILTGCATQQVSSFCQAGKQTAVLETLYFGTRKPDKTYVSKDQWITFLSTTITPLFPQGLTWWTAEGQWQKNTGEIEKETSFVLQIVHASDVDVDPKIQQITRGYREIFKQEAVLKVTSKACLAML